MDLRTPLGVSLEELPSASCREKRRQAEDILVGCKKPLLPPYGQGDDGGGEGAFDARQLWFSPLFVCGCVQVVSTNLPSGGLSASGSFCLACSLNGLFVGLVALPARFLEPSGPKERLNMMGEEVRDLSSKERTSEGKRVKCPGVVANKGVTQVACESSGEVSGLKTSRESGVRSSPVRRLQRSVEKERGFAWKMSFNRCLG